MSTSNYSRNGMIAQPIYKSSRHLICGLGCILVFAILSLLVVYKFADFSVSSKGEMDDQILAENIVLNRQGAKIDIANLSFPRKEINYISIVVEPPYSILVGANRGISTPDGETFLPQIEVEDLDGIRCRLKFSGTRGDRIAYFGDISEARCFADPREYRTLHITSSQDFTAKKVLWSGFDLSDLK